MKSNLDSRNKQTNKSILKIGGNDQLKCQLSQIIKINEKTNIGNKSPAILSATSKYKNTLGDNFPGQFLLQTK